ncbi:hypothetical protein Gasu2_00540 [Galdieria sulphuraria]|nr:hypothetical protein Gasu2_00540 [Galdieria sulphuraria]
MFQTRFLSLAILGGQRVSLRMDSRKPLSNISNNVCCRSVIVGETFPSSKDGIFCVAETMTRNKQNLRWIMKNMEE